MCMSDIWQLLNVAGFDAMRCHNVMLGTYTYMWIRVID